MRLPATPSITAAARNNPASLSAFPISSGNFTKLPATARALRSENTTTSSIEGPKLVVPKLDDAGSALVMFW